MEMQTMSTSQYYYISAPACESQQAFLSTFWQNSNKKPAKVSTTIFKDEPNRGLSAPRALFLE